LKIIENLVGMKNLAFCSDYNVPTQFQNLHNRISGVIVSVLASSVVECGFGSNQRL
jgi:hypothetical protein